MQQDTHQLRKYFFLTLVLIGTVLAVLLLWPFMRVIVLSIALTVVFTPVFKWFHKRININWLASLLTVLSFLIVLCIPLFFIGSVVFSQSQELYSWITQHGGVGQMIDGLNTLIGRYVPIDSVDIVASVQNAFGNISAGIGTIFATTIATLFSFFLVVLSMFYFFKDGSHWKTTLLKLSPLSDESDQKIITKLKDAVNGIVRGYLLIGLVQGVLMGLGLWMFGVPNAALWGVVTGIASLIPTIGTALVSIPAVIFLFISGNTGAGVGMAIWAGVLVGSVDNVLNPYLVGRKIDIHPLLVLFAVLGGIALMGPIGILIGPLIISFLYALISVYKSEVV